MLTRRESLAPRPDLIGGSHLFPYLRRPIHHDGNGSRAGLFHHRPHQETLTICRRRVTDREGKASGTVGLEERLGNTRFKRAIGLHLHCHQFTVRR